MNDLHGQWYIRRQGEISGPFNASVISKHLQIGRLSMEDEVSADSEHWLPLAKQPLFHADSDKADRARRYLDERTGLDRRHKQKKPPREARKRRGDRRSPEPEETVSHRALRRYLMQQFRQRREKMFWPLLTTFALLLAIVMLATFYPSTIPVPMPNCTSPAAPGVNWDNCLKPELSLKGTDLSGASLRNSQMPQADLMNALLADVDLAYAKLTQANLSYSNLNNASLFGSDLTEADLSYANLSGADLAYADLSNARLGGAELKGARLDRAIWIDGRECAEGSTGECLLSAE
ncbi:MAG: pentapeptide repeat-containing protein [Pseudomonadota bacterium]|nr:pentapeptide repeat-containing protein [Pseudomonadota bacterium]